MYLKRMLTLAGMALATAAFMAPAAAQAQTHGLTENGVFIGAGAGVTITSTNIISHSLLGTETCAKFTLHYTVETNTDEHLALSPVGETTNGTTENCVMHTGGATGTTHVIHITKFGTDTATVDTWGVGEVQLSMTKRITLPSSTIECTYTGKVKFTAVKGTSTLNIGKSMLNGGLCGNGEIVGTGTIETSSGTALTADIAATT